MEGEQIADAQINIQAMLGAQRFLNAKNHGTGVITPAVKVSNWSASLADRHNRALDADELQSYYLELLQRADNLVKIIDSNVGPTSDFPIRIKTDRKETSQLLNRHLNALRSAVGLLLEL